MKKKLYITKNKVRSIHLKKNEEKIRKKKTKTRLKKPITFRPVQTGLLPGRWWSTPFHIRWCPFRATASTSWPHECAIRRWIDLTRILTSIHLLLTFKSRLKCHRYLNIYVNLHIESSWKALHFSFWVRDDRMKRLTGNKSSSNWLIQKLNLNWSWLTWNFRLRQCK